MGAAVGEQDVEEGVIRPGFEAAEEHPVLHTELGGMRARPGRLAGGCQSLKKRSQPPFSDRSSALIINESKLSAKRPARAAGPK